VALLSDGEHTRRTVWQVSERAWEAGVRPGQLVSQAVSLCPSLTLLEPDPAHYDAATEAMLEALSELTPVLEPAGRGRVFLGMDGLERLFGPPEHQTRRALRALFRVFPSPLVAATRAGMAPGKFGAWVAATAARPGQPVVVPEAGLTAFLAPCPVGVLPVDPLMIQRLERLDVATLEELRRLPQPSLVAQFGPEGRHALAHLPVGDLRTDLADLTRTLIADHVGLSGHQAAGAMEHVTALDAHSVHVDHDAVRCAGGLRTSS